MALGTQLWLVRHGETEWNVVGRVQGHTKTELNEKGRLQAGELGRRLRGKNFAAVYASDLPRAYQTAEIAVAEAGQRCRWKSSGAPPSGPRRVRNCEPRGARFGRPGRQRVAAWNCAAD